MTTHRTLPASLDSIRTIASEQQAAKLRWPKSEASPKARQMLCDLFTASAIVAVADAVNEDNRAKLARMIAHSPERLARVQSFAFQHVR